jgi:hypothetical protein
MRASQARLIASGRISLKCVSSEVWQQHMDLLTGGRAAANLVHGREAVRSDILAMGD